MSYGHCLSQRPRVAQDFPYPQSVHASEKFRRFFDRSALEIGWDSDRDLEIAKIGNRWLSMRLLAGEVQECGRLHF